MTSTGADSTDKATVAGAPAAHKANRTSTAVETRVLDAARACMMRWGESKVTIDDIVHECGVSRATIYRLFPGGREVLFEALRGREITEFFTELDRAVSQATSLDEVVVTGVTVATSAMRADEGLVAMLATEPDSMLRLLTADGLPGILQIARMTMLPHLGRYLGPLAAERVLDVIVRLTISYYVVPSGDIDLTQPDHVRNLVAGFMHAELNSHDLDSPDPLTLAT